MSLRIVVASFVTLIIGCGGGKTPPASAGGAPPADAAAESFGEVNPADVAELDGGASKAPDASPSAAAASASSATGQAPEADECTPAGVDFEKRARPKLKECYAEGKKKDPNLQGTVRVAVEISIMGKVKGIKITEKTLPEPVAQCMLKVVKATPFPDAPKCWGKSLTIPMTFPTQR